MDTIAKSLKFLGGKLAFVFFSELTPSRKTTGLGKGGCWHGGQESREEAQVCSWQELVLGSWIGQMEVEVG